MRVIHSGEQRTGGREQSFRAPEEYKSRMAQKFAALAESLSTERLTGMICQSQNMMKRVSTLNGILV